MMRFCMVTTFYPPYHFGGDGTFVRALSRALIARGHEVEVVHCEDAYLLAGKPVPPDSAAADDGIVVHRLKSRFGPLSPLITQQTGHPGLKTRTLREILDRPFDVVHFHNVSLVGGPSVLGMSRAPVTLYTMHEHWLLCPTHIFWKDRSRPCDAKQCIRCCIKSRLPPQAWRYTGLIQRAAANVDLFLSPSEYTARLHRESGIAPVQVLPHFSTLAPPPSPKERKAGKPGFLFVGRVTASKGIAELLAQFARYPEYDIDVVGDGDLRAALERKYREHPHIRFLGPCPQSDLVERYRNATALVFPSLAPESFGLTIAEAFACGTPAIVRNAGGSRELVDATGGGIVYGSDAELVAALRLIAGDADLQADLSRRARAGFERLYTEERHVKDYLALVDLLRSGDDGTCRIRDGRPPPVPAASPPSLPGPLDPGSVSSPGDGTNR